MNTLNAMVTDRLLLAVGSVCCLSVFVMYAMGALSPAVYMEIARWAQ